MCVRQDGVLFVDWSRSAQCLSYVRNMLFSLRTPAYHYIQRRIKPGEIMIIIHLILLSGIFLHGGARMPWCPAGTYLEEARTLKLSF